MQHLHGDRPTCAVLTPAGRGAIATVAVRGPGAVEIVAGRLRTAARKPLTDFPAGSVVFGRFQTSPSAAEELVVGLAAPGAAEIHCHGGRAAVQAICDALQSDGCTLVEPADWLFSHDGERVSLQALARAGPGPNAAHRGHPARPVSRGPSAGNWPKSNAD